MPPFHHQNVTTLRLLRADMAPDSMLECPHNGKGYFVTRFVPAAALFALALLAAGTGAQAASFCTAPVPPSPLDGATATAQQLRDAVAKARDFIGQANLYENCLREQLRVAQAQDGDGAAGKDVKVRIAANRHLKDKVSSQTANAMTAYKKAHVD